jgi:hypothetical protein
VSAEVGVIASRPNIESEWFMLQNDVSKRGLMSVIFAIIGYKY